MAKEIVTSEFEDAIKEGVVLVDFFADWCGPCKMLLPVMDEVAEAVRGKATVIKVNVDREAALAQQFQVSSIPAIRLFKDGELIGQDMGFKPKEVWVDMIEKAL